MMKKFITLAAVFAFTATAAAAQATAPTKIGWIDTGMFASEKEGITKYVNAFRALDNEAKPKMTELTNLQARIQNIAKELQDMQKAAAAVPINENVARTKQDEGERLSRELEFKKKEYDAFVQKRGGEILGPINADIGKALQDFGKQKGYVAILDIEKLAQAGAILHLEPSANITKEFIAFYNARPAGAATATVPK